MTTVLKDIRPAVDLLEVGMFQRAIRCYRSPGAHAVLTYRFGGRCLA